MSYPVFFYEERIGTVKSYKFEFKGFGIWIFPDYISIFCDKDSPLLKKIPKSFWSQISENMAIYQRGFKLK